MNALLDLLDTYRRVAVTEREKDGKGLAVLKKKKELRRIEWMRP